MQTQTCRDCGEDKPLSAFAWRKDNGKYRTDYNSCRHFGNTKRLYGVDRAMFNQMREAQGFSCAICFVHEDDAGYANQTLTPLVVDHDHNTGRVRGLLCQACNFMLGKARDNPDILREAATYLEH